MIRLEEQENGGTCYKVWYSRRATHVVLGIQVRGREPSVIRSGARHTTLPQAVDLRPLPRFIFAGGRPLRVDDFTQDLPCGRAALLLELFAPTRWNGGSRSRRSATPLRIRGGLVRDEFHERGEDEPAVVKSDWDSANSTQADAGGRIVSRAVVSSTTIAHARTSPTRAHEW
jgi:hypothetical protein